MKRKNLLALLTFLVATAALSAQTQVIAHRGYWRAPGAAQNSIVALQRADQIKCFGSECDVLQTRDGVLVVHHDAHIGPDKILIEEADYDQIKDIVLSNGEAVPTLQQYLKELKKCKNTLLVLEIKEHSTDQKMLRATRDIVKMVNRMGLKKKVYYISFMPTICDELVRIAPKSQVAYLSNQMTPRQVKERGYTGVDFHYSQFEKNPLWVQECHELGLNVNVWTVNTEELMNQMLDLGVDFITTDYPEVLQKVIFERKLHGIF
ncbi:MAG TPA: glycerophosphodiester phosphodiesterase [Bacteroidetes bacterium]|nr:glycerophosphodiester phosphodiesterase [Bacteroidota bacterium]